MPMKPKKEACKSTCKRKAPAEVEKPATGAKKPPRKRAKKT
jgi:hypothetical protein